MPDPTVFDPHSVDDMGRDAERWHERTLWVSIADRLANANPEQLKQLMNMGYGDSREP